MKKRMMIIMGLVCSAMALSNGCGSGNGNSNEANGTSVSKDESLAESKENAGNTSSDKDKSEGNDENIPDNEGKNNQNDNEGKKNAVNEKSEGGSDSSSDVSDDKSGDGMSSAVKDQSGSDTDKNTNDDNSKNESNTASSDKNDENDTNADTGSGNKTDKADDKTDTDGNSNSNNGTDGKKEAIEKSGDRGDDNREDNLKPDIELKSPTNIRWETDDSMIPDAGGFKASWDPVENAEGYTVVFFIKWDENGKWEKAEEFQVKESTASYFCQDYKYLRLDVSAYNGRKEGPAASVTLNEQELDKLLQEDTGKEASDKNDKTGNSESAKSTDEKSEESAKDKDKKPEESANDTDKKFEESAKDTDKKSEESTNDTDKKSEENTKESQNSKNNGNLPPYGRILDDEFTNIICQYILKDEGKMYEKGDVTVPVFIIGGQDMSNPDDILTWGNFWIYNFSLEGKTLMNINGGNTPGFMHLRMNGNSYEVISWDKANTASDLDALCAKYGKNTSDFSISESERDRLLNYALSTYVETYNLDIDSYQFYGWDKVMLSF